MSEEANEEISFPIKIPNNTFGIFVSCEPGTQNLMLQSFEFIDDSIIGTKEYDAMAVLSTQIVDLISQLIDSFVEEVDEDFTKSEFDDGDRYGLPFPKLNTVH
jgi:hypothetical protein